MQYNTGINMPVKKVIKKASAMPAPDAAEAGWTFLSNHTHVLVCLAGSEEPTVRDIASEVGITERAVMRILSDLEAGGVLERERDGRRNRYRIDIKVPLRHPLEEHCTIGDILALVNGSVPGKAKRQNK
jgi:DNA-binding transcriptional ArsR family regulator